MKLVDSRTMAEIDRQAQERFRIPQAVLMEDAALGSYRLLHDRVWGGRIPEGELVVLAGKGNNGGDALVMARQCLLDGKRELLVVLGSGVPAEGSLAAVHLGVLEAMGAEILDFQTDRAEVEGRLRRARWIIDGLLGTGLQGEARGALAELIGLTNESPAQVAAVDVPSGVGDAFRKGFPAVRAGVTLTIGLPKLALYLPAARALCGEIRVVEGVFPRELLESERIPAELLGDEQLPELLQAIPADTYKTARGHLAVFAGAEGTTGAAWLCSHAAAHSRTGLVTVQMERSLYAACLPAYSAVMVRPWDPEGPPVAQSLERYTGLLVGPGWGLSERREAWLEFLLETGLPGLLDADGITLLPRVRKGRSLDLGGRWVLTPHPGEFGRLIGERTESVLADPLPRLRETSASLNATVVLKGHCTYISAPDGRLWVLDGMNPALATGGSGDVLSGIIAGQLAGGVEAVTAARLGVLLHATAGHRAFAARGYFTADELVSFVARLTAAGPAGASPPKSGAEHGGAT
jgi:hydroxyethylthiazole kinase-like uncharacterized protein yjeF